jgi:hypothetical protein
MSISSSVCVHQNALPGPNPPNLACCSPVIRDQAGDMYGGVCSTAQDTVDTAAHKNLARCNQLILILLFLNKASDEKEKHRLLAFDSAHQHGTEPPKRLRQHVRERVQENKPCMCTHPIIHGRTHPSAIHGCVRQKGADSAHGPAPLMLTPRTRATQDVSVGRTSAPTWHRRDAPA